nr:hypothetical protein [Tanacetum cinerariifolium]
MRYSFQDTKSHQVIRSRDITFVDSIYGARSAIDSSSLTKAIQKSQVVLVDIPENLTENDSIVVEHGAFFKEGGSETLRVRRSTKVQGFSKNQMCSLVRLPTGKKASQRLWMFKVKEEQDGSKSYKARLLQKPSYVEALNDTSTRHKSEGFQLAWQEENLECRLKKILYGLIQASRLRDVHQVGDEREVEVLRSFNWPPSELLTKDGVLLERACSLCSAYRKRVPYVRRYKKVRAVALLKGMWFEVYRDYLRRRAVK